MIMHDDDLVNTSYEASLAVMKKVMPFVSKDEAGRQLERSVISIPGLIAAGNVPNIAADKREHALGEAVQFCRQAIVILSFCRDLYGRFVNGALCTELIKTYRMVSGEIAREMSNIKEGREVAS